MCREDGLCQEVKRLLNGHPESAGVNQSLHTLAAAIAGLRADHLSLADAAHSIRGRLGVAEARVQLLEQRLQALTKGEPCGNANGH